MAERKQVPLCARRDRRKSSQDLTDPDITRPASDDCCLPSQANQRFGTT